MAGDKYTAAEIRTVNMEFHYRDTFGPAAIPEAYERLIFDALNGDMSLFTRGDRAELAWELLDPILEAWQTPGGPALYPYEPGSWGPREAVAFLNQDGRTWVKGCGGHQPLAKNNPLIPAYQFEIAGEIESLSLKT
jgi:glucose-6-phosphate 1-dehydrogenase